MHETLYQKIINAPLDYLGDKSVTPLGNDRYTVSAHCYRWYARASDATREEVTKLLQDSRFLPPPHNTFTGTWRYRENHPEDYMFKDWIRVYYNERECHAEYKSDEEKAYQSIIGLLLENTGESIQHLKRDLGYLCTDDETTGKQFDLYDELVGAIADYQDEQAKKGTTRE